MNASGTSASRAGDPQGIAEGRALLAERLRPRATEIERAVLDRLHATAREQPVRELEYLQGLNEAVRAGVAYGIEVIAGGEERAGPMPLPLLAQGRLAARHRIPLDQVIRRYMTAKTTLTQFVFEEAAAMADLAPAALSYALVAQESVFDQLITAASEEYRLETAAAARSREGRLVERVRRLLDGEAVDPSPLEYDLSVHHLGLVARSSEVRPLLRKLAAAADGRLLAVSSGEEETWAWLGRRLPLDLEKVVAWIEESWPGSVRLGIGEPDEGLPGWRRTHGQAREAAGLAKPGPHCALRYRDVALITGVAKDPLLLSSLQAFYLTPLGEKSSRDVPLRETLRAYFAADGNASSASSALGVSRQTVTNRLVTVGRRLNHDLAKWPTPSRWR